MEIHERVAKKVFIIGCGRWGTFIAWYLDKIGHTVTLYGRESSANMQQLMQTRRNAYVQLPETLQLTTELQGVEQADYILISVASQSLYSVCDQLAALQVENKPVILCMKGIEISTGRRLSQIVADALPQNPVAVWLGPGHVQEFTRGVPNCMVIDSENEQVKNELVQGFSSDLIRFYYGTDLIGNEIGAAAKNVMGIAAGMLEGKDLSSLKGALMSRGTHEIAKLIVAMGGKPDTVYGLCHLGDYEATLFSHHSQNLSYGKDHVQGKTYHKLAEGYYTVKALCALGEKYGVELPICQAVYGVLYEGTTLEEVLKLLFSRDLRDEFV